MNKIRKTPIGLDRSTVSPDEFVAVDDDNSDDENEMNNAAPVPASSEMRNLMKNMRSYLDAHSNGEVSFKMDDIEKFHAKEDKAKKFTRLFSNTD
ncbi:hypothetical protein TNCV_4248211 [Trichonephila clavipes]|nr:hypothetical protein TNCV_4248211 [Trichonephila clavipes]